MATTRICSIDGCGKTVSKRGWCGAHYTRWRRYGDPLVGRTFDGDPLAFLKNTALTFEGEECLVWPYGKISSGYGQIYIDGKKRLVSRVVCEHAHGSPPTQEHQAAHNCGNGHEGCCNPKHLRWATRKENEADKLLHGTDSRGERCGTSKLTKCQVLEIRKIEGSQREIAMSFGVSQQTISDIKTKRTWASVC